MLILYGGKLSTTSLILLTITDIMILLKAEFRLNKQTLRMMTSCFRVDGKHCPMRFRLPDQHNDKSTLRPTPQSGVRSPLSVWLYLSTLKICLVNPVSVSEEFYLPPPFPHK